jgi:hypothetical protein
MKVVPLPVRNLRDVPAMMRQVANGIEQGEYAQLSHAIMVTVDADTGKLSVFHWGEDCEYRYVAGALLDASQYVLGHKLED